MYFLAVLLTHVSLFGAHAVSRRPFLSRDTRSSAVSVIPDPAIETESVHSCRVLPVIAL